MKKNILFLIITISYIGIFAQPIRFNRMLRNNNSSLVPIFNQVIQKNDKYICFGNYEPLITGFPLGRINIISAVTDSTGNTINWLPFIDTAYNYMLSSWNSDVKTNDGGYIISGTACENHSPYSYYGYLMKLDSNLNMQWRRYYYDTNLNSQWTYPDFAFQSLRVTSDNGFIAVGVRYKNSGVSVSMVVKFDSLGNQEWIKTYNENYYWSVLYNIETLSNGDYLFAGGVSLSADNNTVDDIIIKTDSLGNILWQKILGGSKGDGHIFLQNLSDSIVLVYIAKSDSAITSSSGTYMAYSTLQFYKLSSNTGDTLWSFSYGDKKISQVSYSFRVFTDGSAMASGSYGLDGWYPWLLKLSSEGSVEWYKEYSMMKTNNSNYFYGKIIDLQNTDDKGYITCGSIVNFDTANYGCCWLMKIDAQGNWQDSSTYIMPGVKLQSSITLYPNPASNQLTVSYFSEMEEAVLEIYNTLGIKQMEVKLPQGQNSHSFSISHLAKGYYKAILKEKGNIRGQQGLVVE